MHPPAIDQLARAVELRDLSGIEAFGKTVGEECPTLPDRWRGVAGRDQIRMTVVQPQQGMVALAHRTRAGQDDSGEAGGFALAPDGQVNGLADGQRSVMPKPQRIEQNMAAGSDMARGRGHPRAHDFTRRRFDADERFGDAVAR